jgi:hypothetical protein
MANLKNWKDESRKDWATKLADGETLSTEKIQLGAILRIADATELMASEQIKMKNDLEWYKRRYYEQTLEIQEIKRSNAALRGHITRLKKNLSETTALLKARCQREPEDVKQK